MTPPIDRRQALTALGAVAGSFAALPLVRAEEGQPHPLGQPKTYPWRKPERPVTAAIMGAGARGNGYARYAAARRRRNQSRGRRSSLVRFA